MRRELIALAVASTWGGAGVALTEEQANYPSLEIGGLVEVEVGRTKPYEGPSSSDIVLATVELGLNARINPWVSGEVLLLYEDNGDEPLDVDVAMAHIAPPEGPWFVHAGQFYVPFGVFDTNMVSDPLTLELGETRESALEAGFESGNLSGSVYLFNGDNKKGGQDEIDNCGANLGVSGESEGFAYNASLAYINDLGDSDTLQDAIAETLGSNDVADHVPGWALSASVQTGPFTFIGEYLAATDEFDPAELPFGAEGAKPEAWMLEAGYGFDLSGKQATVAIGYQETAVALGLAEKRALLALSVAVMDNTSLAFELARDQDYSLADGGTGKSANTLTAQLAVEF